MVTTHNKLNKKNGFSSSCNYGECYFIFCIAYLSFEKAFQQCFLK